MFTFLKAQILTQKLKNSLQSGKATLLLIEIVSIFTAVTLAFMLSKWNENKNNRNLEIRLLKEIYAGLIADSIDMSGNKLGHEIGLGFLEQMKPIFKKDTSITYSLHDYNFIFRTFISIQNTSGYESLKSVGLDKVSNDTLLSQLIKLYEFDYEAMEKIEEQYIESQFVQLYLKPVNDIILNSAKLEEDSIVIRSLNNLNTKDKNLLKMSFYRMEGSRKFNIKTIDDVLAKVSKVKNYIKTDLLIKGVTPT